MSNSLLRAGVFFSILAGLLVFGAVLVSAYGFVPSAAPAARGGSFTTATPTPVPSPVEIISTPVPSSTGNAFSNNAPVIIASSTSTSSSGETSATSSVLVRSRPVHMRMAQASISGCVDGGDCVLSTDAELPTGSVLNYHSFTIPSGVTLTIRDGTNGGSLTINAVDVTIAGTITSAGTNGGDGQDGKLFGRNGASGGAGGAGGTVTINADGRVEVTDSGRISVNGGDGGQGGDNTCVGDCKASAGGNGGNAGAVSIRAADLTVNGIVFASGGSGGKGGFGDGCDGHGGNGGIGGSGGTITLKYITYTQRQPQALSGNYSITGGGFGGIARDIRTTANNIMTTPLQTWAGSGGLGGGHDTDWLCKIDGYSGSNGRAGASGSMGTVTTIQRVLATITITPATATVQSGSGQMFAANGVDTEGFVYPVSPIWAVTDPTIGSIPVAASSAALFTANLVGTTTITASQNGVSGTATVTVTPGPVASLTLVPSAAQAVAGQGVTLTATLRDAAGNAVADGTDVSFATTLGQVNPASAQTASGIAVSTLSSTTVGTATATASSGSASASVDVQFTPAPPANIVLAANPANVVAGQASTITAVVTDQYGNVVPGATVTLTANGAGTFNDSAPVTDAAGTIAVSLAVTNTPGTYSIGAASGSASASTQLTVVVGPAASLTLVANASSAVVGNPVLLTATVRDAVGNLVTDGTPVIFEVVSNTSAATVSPAGQGTVNGVAQSVLTSLADQTVTVAALAGSISNTTTVTFIPNAPTAVNFAARPGTIAAGTQSILAALVRDQYGNFIPTSVNFNAGGAGTLTVIAQNAQSGFNHIMTIGDSIPGPAGVAISLSAVNGIGYGPGVVPNATFTITDSRGTSQVTLQPGEIGGTPEALVKLNQVFPGVNQLLYTDIQFYFAALARVDAAAVGNYTVSASSGAASNSTGLSVVPGAIARVDVLPLNPSVAIDQPINFTAYAYDQFNNPVQFTPQWASGNATVGSVQATSDPHIVTFVPAHVGQAAVSATDSATATTGSSIVTVTPGTLAYIIINAPSGAVPSGTNYTFTATAYDSFNNVVTVVPAWSVDNATVGAIDAATGVFSAAYPGTAVINATQGNVSNSTAVSVVAGAPFSMLLSANPQSITAGGSSAIDATVLDWLGLPVVDGTNVSFSSSTGSVTPVVQTVGGAASATFTSTQAGNATITASSGIAANQTWVIVSPAALDHIIVSPANVTVASSSSTVFNATGYDQYNNPIALGAANWSSSNTTIGTLTDLGAGSARFDAMVAGAAVITASVGLISGTAQASVTPGTLAWIEVTPANLTVPNGATQVFQVLGHDSFNNIVFVQADWTVSGGIGGVNPVTGAQSTTFTATNAGSGSVNAFAGAFTNSSSVQVTPNAVPVVQGIVTINGVATPLANGIVLNATTVDVIAFNSTSYDPDGSISATLWVFGDGSNSTVENTTHLYSSGVHNALLRVTDDNSVSSIIPFVVNVVQALPPVAAFSANATTIYAGDSVFFDASASIDPDGGAIVSYQWDFGDLFTGAGVNATHRYLSVGNYVAVLTVTDDEGWTDSDNVSITVIAVPGNLSGTVVDAHGAPLAGANVSVDGTGYWAQSDGSGSYVVPGIPPGSYNVTASLASYYPAGASVLINTSAVTGRNFTLTVIPGTLMGAVTDSLGSPLNGANVSVEGTAYWALTNSSGAYEMTVADPGTCNVTASLAGYYPQAVGISIPANATTVQNFTLTIIPGNLSGTVRDQDGAPLAGANVSIDGTGYWTLSNGAGGYAINGIAPGAYMVTASRDWYLPQSAGATIAANATTVRNPVLTITGAFNGTVVDMDTGAPLNGTMEVWQGGSLVQSASIVNGLYWATQLLPGYYNLTANAPGYVYPLVQTNKQVLGGQNSTVNVALWGS